MHDDHSSHSCPPRKDRPLELSETRYVLPGVRRGRESGSSSESETAAAIQQDETRTERASVAEIVEHLFRNSAVPYLLGGIVAWFVGAFVLYPGVTDVGVASDQWLRVFVLQSSKPEYYWAWLTSIVTHGGLMHLLINSIALFFAGVALEHHIGSRHFLSVFFISAIVANAAQVGVVSSVGETMRLVGASGGISGVFGALLTIEPDGEVRMFFIIPMRMWTAMLLFLLTSISTVVVWGVGAGGVAHIAHVAGLLVGVAYGLIRDSTGVSRILDAVSSSHQL